MSSYLLLQIRDPDEAVAEAERACFARMLEVPRESISVWSLLEGPPPGEHIRACDALLVGGSGRYSVVTGAAWQPAVLEFLAWAANSGPPMFASCWGFQALALAMGGRVVTDLRLAELGTREVQLTESGELDPVFGALPDRFLAAMGHQDIVMELPPGVVRLAGSETVANQAFQVANRPVYATQFHPELRAEDLVERLRAYPEYVERIAGEPMSVFERGCLPTPHANALLAGFRDEIVAL